MHSTGANSCAFRKRLMADEHFRRDMGENTEHEMLKQGNVRGRLCAVMTILKTEDKGPTSEAKYLPSPNSSQKSTFRLTRSVSVIIAATRRSGLGRGQADLRRRGHSRPECCELLSARSLVDMEQEANLSIPVSATRSMDLSPRILTQWTHRTTRSAIPFHVASCSKVIASASASSTPRTQFAGAIAAL
jgi:hypothetical protein